MLPLTEKFAHFGFWVSKSNIIQSYKKSMDKISIYWFSTYWHILDLGFHSQKAFKAIKKSMEKVEK